MVELKARMAVSLSFRRAKRSGDVLGRFYELFFASDPEVRRRFANTALERQKSLLHTSLEVAIFAAADDTYSHSELDRIRTTHGTGHLEIPARLYELWRDSLIQAVSEFDPEYDQLVASRWRNVLQPVIDYLQSDWLPAG